MIKFCLIDFKLDNNLKKRLNSKGYFVYELGDQALYGQDVIANKIMFECIGSIIVSEPLEIDYRNQTLGLFKTLNEMSEMPKEERLMIYLTIETYQKNKENGYEI